MPTKRTERGSFGDGAPVQEKVVLMSNTDYPEGDLPRYLLDILSRSERLQHLTMREDGPSLV